MWATPSPWQIALARLEGALPFLTDALQAMLAQRSLRRLWAHHVTAFPFYNYGLEHTPNLAAAELTQTSYAPERTAFLSWIARRGPPRLAEAARLALISKGLTEAFSGLYEVADRALDRIDAHLPAHDPAMALSSLVTELCKEELDFLEGETESVIVLDHAFDLPAARGAAWAASLAAAMRPHLFGFGGAPFALAGLLPRSLFRPLRDTPITKILQDSIARATAAVSADLRICRDADLLGAAHLAQRNSSSRSLDAWPLMVGLGPLTRAELARALAMTKRTASKAAKVLEEAGLAKAAGRYSALQLTWPYADLPSLTAI